MNALILLIEKAFWTYIQTLVSLLAVSSGPGIITLSTAQAAGIAAIPAALTVIANGMPVVPAGLPFGVDLLLRAVRTYVVAFVGLLVAVPVFGIDYSAFVAAAAGALPATLAVVKGLVAAHIGRGDSAATLPAKYDTPTVAAA